MKSSTVNLLSAVFCLVGCVLLLAFAVAPVPAHAAEQVADAGFITWLLANVPDVLQALSLIVGGASTIAALTPTPKDDGVLLWLRKVIDFLALNVLGAKNAKPTKDSISLR